MTAAVRLPQMAVVKQRAGQLYLQRRVHNQVRAGSLPADA